MNKQLFVPKRNVGVEFLRIFAIITVLWQHIVVSFTTNFLLSIFSNAFSLCSVLKTKANTCRTVRYVRQQTRWLFKGAREDTIFKIASHTYKTSITPSYAKCGGS